MADAPNPTANPMVKLQIDGQEVTVKPGTTILQAAQKVGKSIPHFCYHPGLPIVGQCRMCFVEIEGAPKLATSCSATVAENMKVLTASPKVQAGQNATLEFTLLNHPLDCPICDRGGECKLQDYTYDYGPPLSRMIDEKEEKDKHRPVSAQVILDQERCILCTRCVRFSSDVDGRAELVTNQRGHYAVVDVFEGRPMESKFSGNVIDLCPVGALTAKDFRFQARPWELRHHEAVCTGCAVGCNIEIHTKHRHLGIARPDGSRPTPEIRRLVPRENPQVNTWWMCDKGRWGYHFHNDEGARLTQPRARRTKGSPQEVLSLREIQKLMEQSSAGAWEFWVDDNVSHEGIAWAKELRESWLARGRKVEPFNPSPLGRQWLEFWATRMPSPWTAGTPDWSTITKVVSEYDVRQLEEVAPILALRLGQDLRKGRLQWEQRPRAAVVQAKDDLEKTAYLYSPPRNARALSELAKLPGNSKLLLLWTQANSRGLLNEGICPVEVLEEELVSRTPTGAVFYFGQRTQNGISSALVSSLKKASFVMVADSFKSELSEIADILLPLTPLYESEATLTNLENRRQVSRGIHVDHPNAPLLHRGGPVVPSSLRLL